MTPHFVFYQKFNFGSDIILRDISKICSLEKSSVRKIILDHNLKKIKSKFYIWIKNILKKKILKKLIINI